jgi:hypothetical protein
MLIRFGHQDAARVRAGIACVILTSLLCWASIALFVLYLIR